MKSPFTKEELKKQLAGILEYDFRTDSKNATDAQLYRHINQLQDKYTYGQTSQNVRKIARPVVPLFSGWNWQPKKFPLRTAATTGTP